MYFLDISDTSGRDSFGIFWATSSPESLAFQLYGTGNTPPPAPEPGTWALLASGGAAMMWMRRKRRL